MRLSQKFVTRNVEAAPRASTDSLQLRKSASYAAVSNRESLHSLSEAGARTRRLQRGRASGPAPPENAHAHAQQRHACA
eukprot:6200782-Pleurochrysis_carterae.AAC.1